MNILVTGGTGYIGSHVCTALLEQGHEVVILDNLSNSNSSIVHNIEKITNEQVTFIEGDVRDRSLIESILRDYDIEAVFHFAGLKSVSESISHPLQYFDCNVAGTLSVLEAMEAQRINTFVFSSSATVYGVPDTVPINEECPTSFNITPYGQSKLLVEHILESLAVNKKWNIACLRYFNPVGAHESGLIGESPTTSPTNVMPCIVEAAAGLRELQVFGNTYPTIDGSGVRDYIHVMDLADGHVAALKYVTSRHGMHIFNLGTGKGTSVLELISAFENVNSVSVNHSVTSPRPGDVSECWADPSKANNMLQWKAKRTIEQMCKDAWIWFKINKNTKITLRGHKSELQ